MQPKAVTSPIKKCRVGTKKNKNKQLKIMQKLIKLFQLVLAGSALICTLTTEISGRFNAAYFCVRRLLFVFSVKSC